MFLNSLKRWYPLPKFGFGEAKQFKFRTFIKYTTKLACLEILILPKWGVVSFSIFPG